MTSAELPAEPPDVLVVGAGNAALCAAISAHENGARVLMLEAAPFEERGGNSHFTGGAFRFAFSGVDDLIEVLPALAQENLANIDFGTYTQDQFFDDLFALTQFRSDPDLAEILGRSGAAHLGRRAGITQGTLRQCGTASDPDPVRDARPKSHPRERTAGGRHGGSPRRAGRDPGRGGRARLRQLRIQPGNARALS